MSKEKIFRGVMIFYIICLCFLIGLIAKKFTLHSQPVAQPTISVQGMDVTEKTSPEELVNHIYQWIQLDSQRSKTIFAEGMPGLAESESGTNILDLVLDPKLLVNTLIDWTVGIRYGQPETYVSTSIPQLEVYRQRVTQTSAKVNSGQEPAMSTERPREPKLIVSESGRIYLGIPKEEMLHQKVARTPAPDQGEEVPTDLTGPKVADQGAQPNTAERIDGEEQGANEQATIRIERAKPRILIYHTHSTETYLDDTSPQDQQCHVFLPNQGKIVDVGAKMAESLEKHGFEVYHDTSNYMVDGMVNAYTKSYNGVAKAIQEQHFDIVLDLHRDGTGLKKGTVSLPREQYVTEINGQSAARVLLLISLGKEGWFKSEEELNRVYPHRKENYAFAANLAAKMQEVYPGLLRRLEPTKNKLYNQQVHKHALLVEVGFELNSISEAVYTGELLGDVIAELYKDQPASVLINQ